MKIELKICNSSPLQVAGARGINGGQFDPTVDQKKYELIDELNTRIAVLTVDPNASAQQAAESLLTC